jgi:hypothetical protein
MLSCLLFIICLCVCVCVSVAETIKRVLRDYHERISTLEDEKFDLEYAVKKKDFEVEFVSFQSSVFLQMTSCAAESCFSFLWHKLRVRFQAHVSDLYHFTLSESTRPQVF